MPLSGWKLRETQSGLVRDVKVRLSISRKKYGEVAATAERGDEIPGYIRGIGGGTVNKRGVVAPPERSARKGVQISNPHKNESMKEAMREPNYLFDTDAVIDMIKEKEYKVGAIPIVTVIEVLRGVKEEKREKTKQLLEDSFNVLGLENRIVLTYCRLYGSLKEEGEPLPDADLFVASTAIAHDLTLKSRDGRFKRLEEHGLALERPKKESV